MIGGAHSRKKGKNIPCRPEHRTAEHCNEKRCQQPNGYFREEIAKIQRFCNSLPPYRIVQCQIIQPFGKQTKNNSDQKKENGCENGIILSFSLWRSNPV